MNPHTYKDLRTKLANYPVGGTGRRFSTDTDAILALVSQAVAEANRRTLETIAALLNGDSNQVEVVKGYVRNKLLMNDNIGKANEDIKKDELGSITLDLSYPGQADGR